MLMTTQQRLDRLCRLSSILNSLTWTPSSTEGELGMLKSGYNMLRRKRDTEPDGRCLSDVSVRGRRASTTIVRSITQSEKCSVVTNPCIIYTLGLCTCGRAHSLPDVARARTPRCARARAWFQARDIIGKMASTCGEVSGASSVFCRAILGKVQTFC